jgi:hypothetical protein
MKAASHREWYRNLGNDPFPAAFRHAPPWVLELMRRSRKSVAADSSRRVQALKAFLVAQGLLEEARHNLAHPTPRHTFA